VHEDLLQKTVAVTAIEWLKDAIIVGLPGSAK
jgi:hypothetical protein